VKLLTVASTNSALSSEEVMAFDVLPTGIHEGGCLDGRGQIQRLESTSQRSMASSSTSSISVSRRNRCCASPGSRW